MDLYGVLGVEKTSNKDEIKKAYRKLAMKYHPDRNSGDSGAEQKFKEINEAYSVLSDDSKRQQYDAYGSVGGAGGFGGGQGFGGVDVDLGDIFESFFGGGGNGGGQRTRRSTVQKGEDLEYMLHIDLKTSIYGGKEKISFNKKESCTTCNGEGGSGKQSCNKCHGSGRVTYTQKSIFGVIQQTGTCDECQGSGESFSETCSDCKGGKRQTVEKSIEIDVPAGIDDGMIIKLTGEGNDGIGTKACGDMYVKFRISLSEKGLSRKGVDLYYDIEIDVIEAILGTKKDLNLPILGKRSIEINAGTQIETVLKLSKDGVKYIDKDSKGDLFINVSIKIPKRLGKKERELFEEIARERKLNVNNKKGVFESLFG